jgi:hypothetical protein
MSNKLHHQANFNQMWQFFFEDKTSKIGKGGIKAKKGAKKTKK